MDQLGFIVENDLIQSALFEAIDPSNITIINAKLDSLLKTDIGYIVTLDDESNVSCNLVVGADGSQSKS